MQPYCMLLYTAAVNPYHTVSAVISVPNQTTSNHGTLASTSPGLQLCRYVHVHSLYSQSPPLPAFPPPPGQARPTTRPPFSFPPVHGRKSTCCLLDPVGSHQGETDWFLYSTPVDKAALTPSSLVSNPIYTTLPERKSQERRFLSILPPLPNTVSAYFLRMEVRISTEQSRPYIYILYIVCMECILSYTFYSVLDLVR